MKKLLLSALLMLTVTSVANADPRFGVIGTTGQGHGLYVTDDVYTAGVTYASADFDGSEASAVILSANYKMAVDNKTGLTVGVDYSILDSDASGEQNQIGLTVGVERAIAANLALIVRGNVYTSNDDTDTTSIFNGGVVGVALLF